MTVLVVEDETLLRNFAADFLDEAGFKVFEALNAEEALTILQARPDIQAVITDVEMPGPLNGCDLARVVHKRWPGVRVIATSGRAQPPAEEWPEHIPFITKPYLPNTIVELVKRLAKPQVIALRPEP
ncbi:response regulator [Microvirga massiliensis]|uniref:response regulator n=1 Tax=Microvirga massiliensis TaxID=1033741 RepID=UPI00093FE530|nr:response regulator [Microvirga massiliensis]